MSTTAVQDIEELQALLAKKYPAIHVDGDIGKLTTATVLEVGASGDADLATAVQAILARRQPKLVVDGRIGAFTMAALRALDEAGDHESAAETDLPEEGPVHRVLASSFADLADVRSFKRCKANGGSDQHCFQTGDNGIGAWGANTAQEETPMVALPREVWRKAGKTGGAKVLITHKGDECHAVLGDTMPSLANIKNGADMDTNPAVAKAFGLHPPYMVPMTWEWA